MIFLKKVDTLDTIDHESICRLRSGVLGELVAPWKKTAAIMENWKNAIMDISAVLITVYFNFLYR